MAEFQLNNSANFVQEFVREHNGNAFRRNEPLPTSGPVCASLRRVTSIAMNPSTLFFFGSSAIYQFTSYLMLAGAHPIPLEFLSPISP
jgi:hypothetical protein